MYLAYSPSVGTDSYKSSFLYFNLSINVTFLPRKSTTKYPLVQSQQHFTLQKYEFVPVYLHTLTVRRLCWKAETWGSTRADATHYKQNWKTGLTCYSIVR